MAQPQKSGVMKWVLLGCGCLLGIGLVFAAGCGALVWLGTKQVAKMGDEAAVEAQAYARGLDAFEEAYGSDIRMERKPFLQGGWQISRVNDGGQAIIRYTVSGSVGKGECAVYLEYRQGKWHGVGVEYTVGGKTHVIGRQFEIESSGDSDWD